jgi:hypothetical protein
MNEDDYKSFFVTKQRRSRRSIYLGCSDQRIHSLSQNTKRVRCVYAHGRIPTPAPSLKSLMAYPLSIISSFHPNFDTQSWYNRMKKKMVSVARSDLVLVLVIALVVEFSISMLATAAVVVTAQLPVTTTTSSSSSSSSAALLGQFNAFKKQFGNQSFFVLFCFVFFFFFFSLCLSG